MLPVLLVCRGFLMTVLQVAHSFMWSRTLLQHRCILGKIYNSFPTLRWRSVSNANTCRKVGLSFLLGNDLISFSGGWTAISMLWQLLQVCNFKGPLGWIILLLWYIVVERWKSSWYQTLKRNAVTPENLFIISFCCLYWKKNLGIWCRSHYKASSHHLGCVETLKFVSPNPEAPPPGA